MGPAPRQRPRGGRARGSQTEGRRLSETDRGWRRGKGRLDWQMVSGSPHEQVGGGAGPRVLLGLRCYTSVREGDQSDPKNHLNCRHSHGPGFVCPISLN